ncbi:MAG: glycosyltransferase [Ginsengibacter sp.]
MIPTKIFISIPWFLPAFRAGGPIQSVANLVSGFNENIHYFIFCGDTDLGGGALENIQPDDWVQFNSHTRVWYSSPEKISDNLVKQVHAVKPDVLYIVGLFSWHYNIVPLIFCKGPRKILSTKGMLHPGALSQKKWKKKIFLKLFSLMEYHYKVAFHASDKEEELFIRNHFGAVPKIFSSPNFPHKLDYLTMIEKQPNSLKLISIAIISPMKNILLVLNALKNQSASIQYDIYGPIKDEDYWSECLKEIKQLPSNISVIYNKEIQHQEVGNALAKSQVFILPSKSENFGHAIFEALSAGRPVITSKNTPWNGLDNSYAGKNVGIENPGELSGAIQFFAGMNQLEFVEWSLASKAYSEEAIDINELRKKYALMFLNE